MYNARRESCLGLGEKFPRRRGGLSGAAGPSWSAGPNPALTAEVIRRVIPGRGLVLGRSLKFILVSSFSVLCGFQRCGLMGDVLWFEAPKDLWDFVYFDFLNRVFCWFSNVQCS